ASPQWRSASDAENALTSSEYDAESVSGVEDASVTVTPNTYDPSVEADPVIAPPAPSDRPEGRFDPADSAHAYGPVPPDAWRTVVYGTLCPAGGSEVVTIWTATGPPPPPPPPPIPQPDTRREVASAMAGQTSGCLRADWPWPGVSSCMETSGRCGAAIPPDLPRPGVVEARPTRS